MENISKYNKGLVDVGICVLLEVYQYQVYLGIR